MNMKKLINFAMWSLIVLMSTVGFTACTDDSTAEQSDGGIAPTGEVPVKFVFNISTNTGNSQTRMTSQTVQADGNFRGIGDCRILAYQVKDKDGNPVNGKHVTDWANANKLFDLSNVLGSGEITNDNSSRVLELSIPNGTNALMFYGKAPKMLGDSSDVKQGHINSFVFQDNTEGKSKFMLVPRVSQYEIDAEGNETAVETQEYKVWTQIRKLLTTILNRIVSNGLHIEEGKGTIGTRDLRAHIWWPTGDVSNYSLEGPLVDLSKLTPAGKGIVTVNKDNSNVRDFCDSEENGEVTLNYKDASGADQTVDLPYTGATKSLKTNVDTYVHNLGTIDWKEYGAEALKANHTLTPLEEILGNAYNSFTIMKTDDKGEISEIRAGSSAAIIRMIEDLWTVTNQVQYATPTSLPEAQAQALAQRISTRFLAYFTGNIDEKTGIVTNCQLKAPKDLVESIKLYEDPNADETYSVVKDSQGPTALANINSFPCCSLLKMPAGSTQLSFKNGEFKFNETMAAYGMGMTDVSPLKYTWPAELLYYGNSPLRTSEKTLDATSYPHTVSTWSNDATWENMKDGGSAVWTGNYVSPSTRSVAMKYNINYATALLATAIYYDTDELQDNNAALHPGETNKVIRVTDEPRYTINEETRFGGQKFELTGIVIGGQPREVGWDFLQKTSNPDNTFTYMVYDNEIPKNGGTWGGKIPGFTDAKSSSAFNYTLVWDNWNAAQINNTQDPVYVALEFRNCSGTDFWGTDNMIRDGGTFYLIGKLDPNTKYDSDKKETIQLSQTDLSEGIIWPKDGTQALPPYDENGNTIKQRRVFMQGYRTIARFGLGKNSLQHAYLTVPDLRSANISLGLSVDIDWKAGLEYNVVIGE